MTAPKPSRRGRETALDMVRTLAVVFALVVPLWFFGQASPSDSKSIRPVDPAPALKDFVEDTKAPVPSTPSGWVVNVTAYDGDTVRIGYVRRDSYAEFAGSKDSGFLEEYAGKGSVDGTVDVDGVTWQRFVSDEHVSLVRTVAGVTLLVGGVRETASVDELKTIAATVR